MSTHKPFNWSNVILIALLVVVVLIPMLMSRPGKNVNTWTKATDVERTIKKLEGLDKLEALEGMPELQAELDSILESIDIPELDSFMLVIPELPFAENGKKGKQITIKRSKSFPSYTEPPEIIGGYDAILENLVYPEKLKEAGIEGTVIVQVYVEKDGSVGKTKLLNTSGYDLFDEAALDAMTKVKFKHAMNNDEAEAVWMALPVIFKLKK
jgi:TonB family protein